MPNQTCSPPLDGPNITKDYLAHYCFEIPQRVRSRWLLLVSLILLFLALGWSYLQKDQMLLSALSPIATVGLLVAGLWQWRGARQEISMDKYYERLNIANQWWKSSPSVRKIMTGLTRDSEDPDMTMYVCLEIDNLEYVVEKYRIGYIDDEQACRGLKAFQVRCLNSSEFRGIARRRVHLGDYTPRTVKVVCRVCDEVDNLVERLHIAAAVTNQVPPGHPPLPSEESGGQTISSVLSFGRRSSDKASSAASSVAGGEAVSTVDESIGQGLSRPESSPPAELGPSAAAGRPC